MQMWILYSVKLKKWKFFSFQNKQSKAQNQKKTQINNENLFVTFIFQIKKISDRQKIESGAISVYRHVEVIAIINWNRNVQSKIQ